MLLSALLSALLLLLTSSGPVLGKDKQDVTHRGKYFVITFAQVQHGDFTPLLQVSTDAEAATVRVTLPRQEFLQLLTVPPFSSRELTLPLETRAQENGIGDHAVKVEADTEVSVVGVNRVEAHNDAFLALPLPLLGMDHYAVTWDFLPFINVAAAYNNTTLTFTFPTGSTFKPFQHLGNHYSPGSTLRVKLDAFQTYQIFSTAFFKNEDLTGTRVQADKPISVYSGSLTAKVLGANEKEHHHLVDHLEDQMFPVHLWGLEYVIIHAPGRAFSSILKVLASQNDTQVTLTGGKRVRLAHAGDGTMVDTDRDRRAFMIRADKPVLAVTFEKSKVGGRAMESDSDPSMVTLVPTNYFVHSVSFMPLNDSSLFDFQESAVVVASKDIGSLRANGRDLPDQRWTAVEGSSWMQVMELNLSHQTYYLDSTNPNATLMVYVFGSRLDESYAFYGGFSAAYEKVCQPFAPVDDDDADNDCDGSVDEEVKDGIDNDKDGRIDEDLKTEKPCQGEKCHKHAVCGQDGCQCIPPYYGEGRFGCVPRDKECLCTAYGDPHTVDFNAEHLEMPLQCRHLLTQVELPDCHVRVYVEGREFGRNPLVSLLDRVEWSYGHPHADSPLYGTASSTGVFFASGSKVPFNTRVASNTTDVVFRVDEDYFYSIDSKCDVQIRYRAPVVTVRRPLPLDQLREREGQGLCGRCDPQPPKVSLSPTQARVRALLSIEHSPYSTSPLTSGCLLIQGAMQGCPTQRREQAVTACMQLLNPAGPVARCAVPLEAKLLYAAIALCLGRSCQGDETYTDAFQVLARC